ncbi:MAG: hypothetical protein MUO77_08965 [Anaerolineales bacterium]|nr:hypothetical protein [Anaerolineales bacterium]
MKRNLFVLLIVLGLIGCEQQTAQSSTPTSNILSSDFSAEFDRLFLSNEPLRYQDNVAFLDAIYLDELSIIEKELVRTKLKQFLSNEITEREFAPDSLHTGVASEIAFLRLQAIQVLAEVGTNKEVEFIQNMRVNPEGEHPLFEEECKKAIEKLKDI